MAQPVDYRDVAALEVRVPAVSEVLAALPKPAKDSSKQGVAIFENEITNTGSANPGTPSF